MKKFIIKIKDNCVFFVEGEIRNLEERLNSLGITIDESKNCSCRESNLGVLFDLCLGTKTLCMGYNQVETEKALSDIKQYLTNQYGTKLAKRVSYSSAVQSAISYHFMNTAHYTDIVKIYVESDEIYTPKPNEYIIPRKYGKITDIKEDEFWYFMSAFAGKTKP